MRENQDQSGGGYANQQYVRTFHPNNMTGEAGNPSGQMPPQEQGAFTQTSHWQQQSPLGKKTNNEDLIKQLVDNLIRVEIKLDQFRASWESKNGARPTAGGGDRPEENGKGRGRMWRSR